MEEPVHDIPERRMEDDSLSPVSSPPASAAKRVVNCLLIAVGVLAVVCAVVVIGALMVGQDIVNPPPTPTPEPVRRVTPLEIRQLAMLESAEYYLVAEVSQVQVPEGWLEKLGLKEEIYILEYGTVVGGFDLTDLPDTAIWQDGERVMLKLPSPEILRVEIDPERSHVVYRRGWCPETVCGDDLARFLQEIEPQAMAQLKEQALEYGLLDRAAKSGRDHFYYFLMSLGFTDVRVLVDGYIYE